MPGIALAIINMYEVTRLIQYLIPKPYTDSLILSIK